MAVALGVNGGILGPANTPSLSSASGLWTWAEQYRAQRGGAWPTYTAPDPYFDYVTLLLHGNGTNGAQNNTFLDSSTNNFTITRNGNTTQGTFTPYGSNWSNYFDGSGDYLSNIGTTSSFNFMHNTSALFTLECWVFLPSTAAAQTIIDNTNGTSSQTGLSVAIEAGGAISLFITRGVTGVGNVTANVTSTGTVPTNQWVHIAVTYDQSQSSNNAKFYINGASAGSGNKTGNTPSSSNASNAMRIATFGAGAGNFVTGYISNLRIVNSVVYTSAFTPPTSPLTAISGTALLTCADNRFIDDSSNAFTITANGNTSVQRFSPFNPTAAYSAATIGGSGYFDGTGDYLATPSTSAIGGTAFTLEGWFYFTGAPTTATILCAQTGSGGIALAFQSATSWGLAAALVAYRLTTTTLPTLNAWNHIVVARSGTGANQTSIWLNGTRVANGTVTDAFNVTSTFFVGWDGTPANPLFTGYMSGFRFATTDVYGVSNTTITVPTAPPTAITNTQLLLNFTNGGIFDNAMMNDLETVGNAQISTAQSKFGGGSIYLDGSGDWLIAPSTQSLSFGTGDFTVEMWLYATSVGGGTERFLFDTRATQTDAGLALYLSTTGVLSVTSSDAVRVTSGTVTANSWVHIAVTRSSGTLAAFVNGVSGSTSAYSSAITCPGSIRIGVKTDGTTPYVGYIDDLRITKGYARYTANFTPPTAPFPDQ